MTTEAEGSMHAADAIAADPEFDLHPDASSKADETSVRAKMPLSERGETKAISCLRGSHGDAPRKVTRSSAQREGRPEDGPSLVEHKAHACFEAWQQSAKTF